jgi:hypothetical protein
VLGGVEFKLWQEFALDNHESEAAQVDHLMESDNSLTTSSVESAESSNGVALEVSEKFIGRWTQLISTTNWEKGKIISQWRDALQASGAASVDYSDEAWSRFVGGVTSQHVGRLRRVYDRFASDYMTYKGIYWSHFLAALDWDDAPMWLEGAVQSKWSVSQMRRTRWEAMGGDPALEPRESEIVTAEQDEDFEPLAEAGNIASYDDSTRSVAEGPRPEDPDFGDEDLVGSEDFGSEDDAPWEEPEVAESPFATLPSLPVDLAEALEQFKLGIIRHRASGWTEVSKADVLKALDALKAFCQ